MTMKAKRIFSIVTMLVSAIFGIVDASAGIMAADAAATFAGVEGKGTHTTFGTNNGLTTDVTRENAPDLIDDPIDKMVVKMFQSGIAVDQVCRYITNVKQNGMRYSFWSVDTRPVADKLTGAFAGTTGTTTQGTILVQTPNMFDISDVIVVPSVAGFNADGSTSVSPLNLYVVGHDNNTGGLIVQAVNGEKLANNMGMLIPAIPATTESGDATPIYRLGHAASEGDVQTTPYAALPEPDELYMQIFKTQIMESTISVDSDKKVNWSLADQQELALYNMRKEIELSYIYGVKGYFRNNTTNRYVYTCSGIIQQIAEKGNMVAYGIGTLTDKKLMTDIVKPIFLGNSGSATRYLFAGSDLVAEIATLESVQRQMGATQVLRKFGVDWKTIQFMSWQLNLYQHPLLDEIGLSHCGFVLDLPHVRKNVFRSLSQDVLELIKAGIFDGKSTVWTEISSIGLKYPKCHAFIKGVVETAATGEGTGEGTGGGTGEGNNG